MTCIALIPARSGSKRIPGKNILPFFGHPLIAYTIHAAKQSGLFSKIVVSTDSKEIAGTAKSYGAEVPFLRPEEYATDMSPDIDWVQFTLQELKKAGEAFDCFSLLRPTSPFRTEGTIKRAWDLFGKDENAHSLRAVEKCSQHPGKMWRIAGSRMKPVLENPDNDAVPWHSMQYQSLPEIYVQNASLEITRTRVVFEQHSISGREITPFVTEGYEGYDINTEKDLVYAKYLVESRRMQLPKIAL